jgi:DNA-binding SARP family transcriptional activator
MSPAIKLLGTVVLQRSDGVVNASGLPTSKALDLLRLLVGAEHQARGADHYIAQLWPTADEERGRMSLRTAVAQLRRALGPDVVRRAGDLVMLGDVVSDVARFRQGLVAADQQLRSGQDAAVMKLVGELEESCGADLVVSSGSCEAVYVLRDELREARAQLLLDAAGAAARLARTRESLELAQKAFDLSGSESAARALMSAWSTLGETRRAIETFDTLQTDLRSAYGVQPSPETRALYLQVVTAGEGLSLRRVEHHRDVVVDLAATIAEMVEGEACGGVVWLHGEPGSGRGAVAREAVRLLEGLRPEAAECVLILPEVIALDDLERQRLRREAFIERSALLVPVRHAASPTPSDGDPSFTIEPLDRTEFRHLLTQLLQEHPSRELEERLWATTGGLAGHAWRTVAELVHHGQLRWAPGEVGLPPRARVPRRSSVVSVRSRPSVSDTHTRPAPAQGPTQQRFRSLAVAAVALLANSDVICSSLSVALGA